MIGHTQIYITEKYAANHVDDNTTCTHGLGIPVNQWTTIALPMTCVSGREVQPRTYPMWIDDIPISEPVMKLNCPCHQPATWILIFGCETNHHIWEEHLCLNCLYTKTGFDRNQKIRNRIYTATLTWTCMNVIIHENTTGQPENRIHCEIDRWYARELTPEMTKRILDEKLTQMRNKK